MAGSGQNTATAKTEKAKAHPVPPKEIPAKMPETAEKNPIFFKKSVANPAIWVYDIMGMDWSNSLTESVRRKAVSVGKDFSVCALFSSHQ